MQAQPFNRDKELAMNRLSPSRSLIAMALAGMLLGGSGSLSAQTEPARVADGVLTGSNGMTLYTFDRDAAGKSACNGQCAANWPPLSAAADAKPSGDYTIIVRDDGSRQWAYKGKPLYFWVKDTKAGDRTGDNVNNVWHLARP
jgi:predicted lipoprotein with Yx(FWY)xxD motif